VRQGGGVTGVGGGGGVDKCPPPGSNLGAQNGLFGQNFAFLMHIFSVFRPILEVGRQNGG
jgi:hypothetical protein